VNLQLVGALVGLATACCFAADYHAGQSPTDMDSQPAFVVQWPQQVDSPADVSFLLEAPAGKNGLIGIKDGHLSYPDGRRFRIWGVNVTGRGGLPAGNDAPRIALNLARVGINCVRFHFMDGPAPGGIIAPGRDDTQELDPGQMDRMDYFIAQLKQRGIYSDLNLNVIRPYKAGDGVKDFQWLGFGKAITFFDDRVLELERQYARALLTHTNPYTGSAYAREPAIAIVEMLNENSLVEAWGDGRLRGTNTRSNGGTWADIPPSYAAELTDQYNAWLRQHRSADQLMRWRQQAGLSAEAPIPRLTPDQFSGAPADRFETEAEFYMETEKTFYLSMAKYLRQELGVKALLVGNSDHNHYMSGYPQVTGASLLDVVDGHDYWQLPKDRTVINTPMVDAPLASSIVELSRSAVAGKPFISTEVNNPFPNEYACEAIPVLAAYASLQNWDGLFWYSLANNRELMSMDASIRGSFNLCTDPVRMGAFPAGALIFLRPDVRPAKKTVLRTYTRQQVWESLRLPRSERPFFTPGFPPALPLQHALRIASMDGPATGTFSADAASPLRSDTGQLSWHYGPPQSGLVVVDTPRTQALAGFVGSNRVRLKNLSADSQTPFCAITLSALDGRPIARSGKLLLTATARVGNSNQEWNTNRTSLLQPGDAPTRIEPVLATLRLSGLEKARQVWAAPLDGAGRVGTAKDQAVNIGSHWELRLHEPTVSYLVIVDR
jgi:hypothetical protein